MTTKREVHVGDNATAGEGVEQGSNATAGEGAVQGSNDTAADGNAVKQLAAGKRRPAKSKKGRVR
jgi:hypothetical protein